MSCAVNSAVSISGQRQVHRQKYAAYVDKAANIDLCKTVLRLALYLSGNGESVYSHMLVQFTHIIYKRQETEKYSLQKDFFKISEEVLALSEKAEKLAEAQFEKIDDITEYNQQKAVSYTHLDVYKRQEKGLVLVDFYADWCMPCKMLSPILEELSEEIDNVKIVKVNTDKNQELASSFGIMSIPTLLFVKDGKVIDTLVGMRPKEDLERVIKSYL